MSVAVTIHPRNIAFGRGAKPARHWVGGDPVRTAQMTALSLTFPLGEAFFIESVRHFRDDMPAALQADIKAFIAQEILHTREHVALNRRVAETGWDVSGIEARMQARMAMSRQLTPVAKLAATAAMEHLTAILGHALLADPAHVEGMPEDVAQLWRWHAIEEIEHKAVAFDTLMAVLKGRGVPARKRWLLRAGVMLRVTRNFLRRTEEDVIDLLQQDGMQVADIRKSLRRQAFGPRGIARQALRHYLAWFLPGFHPWDLDDRKLAAEATTMLPAPTEDRAAA